MEHYSGWRPTAADIDALKAEGTWNNDWDASLELLRRHGTDVPSRNALIDVFSGFYFGWLPLFLPELFETRVRSTGAGVCFNFGRIITAMTVFATSMLITTFDNDYSLIGRTTSLIYLLGAIGICLLPKGVGGEIKD